MAEINRPFGNRCNSCPLSLESQHIASLIPLNSHPEADIAKIKQSCGWHNWRLGEACVTVERTIQDPKELHTFAAQSIIGKAPEDCPLPR